MTATWLRSLTCLGLLGTAACAPTVESASSVGSCVADGELTFVCGAVKPEDLIRIPGSRWIVASGFAPGSGLKLIDTQRRTLQSWFSGEPGQIAPDGKRFPDCVTPPDPALFNARGLSFRTTGAEAGELHVVNHGGRESIEVFAIDARNPSGPPSLAWRGCLLLPQGDVGNSVATYTDGTVLVTVLTRPGTSITDFVLGQKTGYVLERPPGAEHFHVLEGTQLEGNNGLEASPEDDGFYAVSFGSREVVRFNRDDHSGPAWRTTAPEFMPDNIHWHGGQLLAAGMVRDEPACGGTRLVVDGMADTMKCHRGYVAASLDPVSREWQVILRADPNRSFNGVSTALVIGDEMWLGSYQADRIAVKKLLTEEKTN